MSTGTQQAGPGPEDIAQRLKIQVDGYPVRLRPGLAREAFRAHRRHRAVRRSITAAGVAVVIAAGAAFLAAGTIPFGSSPGGRGPVGPVRPGVIPAQGTVPPASLQPAPPGNGLTASQAASDILWTRATYAGASGSGSFSEMDWFHYEGAMNTIAFSSGGKLVVEVQTTEATGPAGMPTSTTTTVDYVDRTWSRVAAPSAAGGFLHTDSLCQWAKNTGLVTIGYSAELVSNPALARELPGCLGLPITRGLRIGGVDAITITDKSHVTLWLNATTYLPIQLVHPTTYSGEVRLVQFGYLPPTSANLAYLAAYLPRGFTHGSGPPVPPGFTKTSS
jgi:hypothetical protein